MTARNGIRSGIRAGVRLGVPLFLALLPMGPTALVSAADPVVPDNLLERPMADVAIIDAADAATTPGLLVLESSPPGATSARVDLLRREGVWRDSTSLDIELGAADLDARWLVKIDTRRYALVATSPPKATGTGHAVVVIVAVALDPDRPAILEMARQEFDRAIEDAAAADVDGFGAAELVLGMRPLYDSSGSCGTTSLVVIDGTVAATRRVIDLAGRLGAGVLGRFDTVAGDDLLAYATLDCPPGGTVVSKLITIRLADGTESAAVRTNLHGDASIYPAPLRVDLDGAAPDEVIAMTDSGLAILDPGDRWSQTLIAGIGSVPLLAGRSPDLADRGVRVALLDAAGTGSLVAADLGRDGGGVLMWERRSELAGSDIDATRWQIVSASIQGAAMTHNPSAAWIGDAVTVGCPDLVLPGAILPCGTDALRSGAAWLATKPVAAMPVDGRRIVLIAAGLGWDAPGHLPPGPAPVADAPAGWWRHGPSTPFALSEVRSEDLVYFRDFPTPTATIETTTASDGSTALPGFTGARLFTAITPLAEGEAGPDVPPDIMSVLGADPGPGGEDVVARVPVPPGLESGRDGSYARLPVADIHALDGSLPTRWSIRVVPINDWGEWGAPVAQTIARDAIGPTVAVENPFLSAIWPVSSRLAGRSEPGSVVQVEGRGPVNVDSRGRFFVDGPLAPWPQMLRVIATDPTGNTTTGEFWVVGGVDYRRFPWPGIIAATLLALIAVRGLFTGSRGRATRVEATRWSTGILDDASMPEIEELPPGSGLAGS